MIREATVKWEQAKYDNDVARYLYDRLNIGYHVCILLAQKGITSQLEAEKFLWPRLMYLDDPSKIENVDDVVQILSGIIDTSANVAIVCDYDVDGITSVTLLINVLKNFGVCPDFFVPKRVCEGYGLSKEIAQRILKKKKYDFVIALDCGTTSVDEVEFLRENGICTVVIDHHQSQDGRLPDCCVVNPNTSTDEMSNPYKPLCTVGLVFKICCALLRSLRKKNDKRASNYPIKNDLDLVTLGTIADMACLCGENRIFCKFGLKILSGKVRRPGIEALCQSVDLPAGVEVKQSDISFKLCPRLNACGRVGNAITPINMLLSDNLDDATTYAYELDEANRERQLIERDVTEQVEKLIKENYANDPGLVLYNKNWHTGVVGIVSGRFSREYNKPCIVLGYEMGAAKGSGRSINGANLIEILGDCKEYLRNWGGHPYAVGVSVPLKNLDAFRDAFNKSVIAHFDNAKASNKIEYSSEIGLEEIDKSFLGELEILQPFGQKNQEPIFLISCVQIRALPEVFGIKKTHVKFWLIDKYSKKMMVIGWNKADNIPPIRTNIDLLVTVKDDVWNGSSFASLSMIDWRLSE